MQGARLPPALEGIPVSARNLRSILAVSAAWTALLAGGPVLAAEAGAVEEAAAAADAPSEVDELIVTARRREENAQDVPIALTVLGGETLEKTGAYNVQQLVQLAPSLQFGSFNPRNTQVNIRGLGNNTGLANDGLEAGVGIYIDQVYYSRPAAATFDLLDIERVEILRGPQGTLFGKNTTAGALNVTTRAPSFDWQAQGELTFGDNDFIQAKGSVSGPLIADTLAARLSVSVTSRDGFVDNVTTGKDVNNQHNIALRGGLLRTPTDAFNLRLTGDYNRQKTDCCLLVFAGVGASLKPAASQYPALAAGKGYSPASLDPFDRKTDANAEAHANQEIGGLSAVADWDLGAVTLTTIAAWRYWSWDPANDADFTSLKIIERSENADEQDQRSLEFRLASNGTHTIDYVAGLYAFWQDIDAEGVSLYGSDATYWLLSPLLPAALVDGYRSDFVATSTTRSYAAFGQLTWHVTDSLSVTPGLRYTYEEKEAKYASTVSGGLATANPTLIAYKLALNRPQAYTADDSDGSFSGQINVAWTPADDLLVYGNWAKGYKSGGLNLSGLPVDTLGNPVLDRAVIEPEETTTVEVGLKSQLFDRRLTANLAIFRSVTTDYQANVVDTAGGALRTYLDNINEVRSQGVELDLRLSPIGGFSAYTSVSYTDAKYVDYENGPCPLELIGAATTACDLSGKALPGVSKWAVSAGAQYEFPLTLGSLDAEAYVGIETSYRSSYYSAATDSTYSRIDGYGLVNLRAGVRPNDHLDVFVWARNVGDEEYFQYISAQAGNSGALFGAPGDPRTVGVTVRATY
ncbi:MAG: TonB-dependent receptor [Caulobacteraceae bacterium]|nr:MAG: TonB-dependent receptor [Caulobacteraceae bacterium]